MLKEERVNPGDEATFPAESWNEICAEMEKRLKTSAAAPLTRTETPSGYNLAYTPPTPIYGLLSETESPYSWTERVPLADGGWDDGAGSGDTNAWEVNDVHDLDGQIARLYPDNTGGYRFQMVRTGGTPVHFTTRGCHNFGIWIYGFACDIEVQDHTTHATLGTGSTNSSGVGSVTVAITVNTVVDIIYTPTGPDSDRFDVLTGTTTLTAGVTNTVPAVSLVPATGYHCIDSCAVPMGETLNVVMSGNCTTAFGLPGSDTLSWGTGVIGDAWYGAAKITWQGTASSYFIFSSSIAGDFLAIERPGVGGGPVVTGFVAGSTCIPLSGIMAPAILPGCTFIISE